MIVKFNNNVIVRSSEVIYAYVTEKENRFCIHAGFQTADTWIDILFDSEEEAEKELDRLMKVMEADEGDTKPKKRAPRRKIR